MSIEFDKPAPPANVLRPPTDADHFRVKVGRYGDRWYTDPLPTCTVADATPDDFAVPSITIAKKAAGFAAAEYVAMGRLSRVDDLDAIAKLAAADRYERFKSINKAGQQEAFARGHGVHAVAEALLYGAPIPLREGSPGWEWIPAVQAFFDAYQPELIAAEFVALHRDLAGIGYGGTCDAGVLVDGVPTIIDWKSRGVDSDHGAYPEEAAQVAAYMRAQYYIVGGDAGAERRRLDWQQGLIVSIKPDSYEVHPLDVDRAFSHWESLLAWWRAKQTEKKAIRRKLAPRATTVDSGVVAPALTHDVVVARFNNLSPAEQAIVKAKRTEAGIDSGDVEAMARLIDDVYHFADVEHVEHYSRPVTTVGTAPVVAPPDEGGDIDDADLAPLGELFQQMTDEANEWFTDLLAQSRHGHSFEMRSGFHRTARRYEIYRGLITLGAWDEFARQGDAFTTTVLEPLVWAASGGDAAVLFDNVTPGVALGSLDAEQARTFSTLVDDLIANRRTAAIDEATGRWRLQAVA